MEEPGGADIDGTCPFRQLSEDASVHRIPRADLRQLTPLQFYRQYVAQSQPVILRGACDRWPALRKWTNAYLRRTMGDAVVSVNVTPTGEGDAVVAGRFVKPEERRMALAQYLDIVEGAAAAAGVFYISHQNGSFAAEYEPLQPDVPPDLEQWGTEVFGVEPDAVNLWMGDDQAVSSMHKDHYENLYAVVRGSKVLVLGFVVRGRL